MLMFGRKQQNSVKQLSIKIFFFKKNGGKNFKKHGHKAFLCISPWGPFNALKKPVLSVTHFTDENTETSGSQGDYSKGTAEPGVSPQEHKAMSMGSLPKTSPPWVPFHPRAVSSEGSPTLPSSLGTTQQVLTQWQQETSAVSLSVSSLPQLPS